MSDDALSAIAGRLIYENGHLTDRITTAIIEGSTAITVAVLVLAWVVAWRRP